MLLPVYKSHHYCTNLAKQQSGVNKKQSDRISISLIKKNYYLIHTTTLINFKQEFYLHNGTHSNSDNLSINNLYQIYNIYTTLISLHLIHYFYYSSLTKQSLISMNVHIYKDFRHLLNRYHNDSLVIETSLAFILPIQNFLQKISKLVYTMPGHLAQGMRSSLLQ